jgi:hypothetical protein
MTDTPSLEKMTKVFVKIRDAKSTLEKAHKAEMDVLTDQLDALKRAMLDYLEQNQLESVRTAAGLVYRSTKTRYWAGDWEAMHAFIVENNVPQLLEKRLNQTAVRDLLESDPDLTPPGLNTDSEYIVTVRKA